MKIETREVYKCEHCNKLYQRKFQCENHENLCKQNPENIPACYSCAHCDKVEEKINVEVYYEDFDVTRTETRNFSLLKCIHLGIYLKPILSEKRGHKIRYLTHELSQIIMPVSCEHKLERPDF